MKKRTKKIIATSLIIALLAGCIPFSISMINAHSYMQKSVSFLQNSAKTANKLEEMPYQDGEVLILYKALSSSKSQRSGNVLGNDMKIENSWEFSNQSNIASKSVPNTTSNSETSFTVSKVTSNTMSTEEMIQKLNERKDIIYAEPNYLCQTDSANLTGSFGEYQWCLDNTGQNNGTTNYDINPEAVWSRTTGGDKVVAIIDTGINYNHQDLVDNLWVNPYQDKLKGKNGYDFANNDADPWDDAGHGSHCAGIIAASGKGITGVTPHIKIMSLKFLGSNGRGYLDDAIASYNYINDALDLGVPVVAINNSWSGGTSNILETVVNKVGEKGAISIAAAGNDGKNADQNTITPWNFDSDYLIKVAASNEKGELAGFSNYGENSIDLAAPGTNILSSVSYNVYNPTIHEKDETTYSYLYENFSGKTKFAENYTVGTSNDANLTYTKSSSENFGLQEEHGQSLCLSFEAKGSGVYGIYYPLNLPASNTNYYVSAAFKTMTTANLTSIDDPFIRMGIDQTSHLKSLSSGNDQVSNELSSLYINQTSNYWNVLSGNSRISASTNGEYSLYFLVKATKAGRYTIYIDNIGISKQNLPSSSFGQYDFYNGTSMAAPQVTGTVALLSTTYPTRDAKSLREWVANCVKKEDGLKNRVKSGGILDLQKAMYGTPTIYSATAKENKVILTGFNFGTKSGKLFVNGQQVTVISWDNGTIEIPLDELLNKQVAIKLIRSDGEYDEFNTYIKY